MGERLKLDADVLGLSSLLEKIAGVRVKDCFKDESNETVYYVVETGDLGKAVGKGGVNIHRAQESLGKRVKVIEYRDNVIDFVRNIIYPLQVQEVAQEGETIIIKDSSTKTKSLLIGREGKNLKVLNRALKRFFKIEGVKII